MTIVAMITASDNIVIHIHGAPQKSRLEAHVVIIMCIIIIIICVHKSQISINIILHTIYVYYI